MTKEHTKHRFEELKKSYISQYERTKRIIPVNRYLHQFNWAFVHPYMIGLEIDHFENLMKKNSGTKEEVFRFISHSFFDLSSTAVLIDGYFKLRNSIKPFCQLIDQSVFMCLERDYAGAINTLLPVIEGSIRHYMVNVVGRKTETIMKTEELLKVFGHLRTAIQKRFTDSYGAEFQKIFPGVVFEKSQIKRLVDIQLKSVDIWISVIHDYFQHALYLDTRTGVVSDKLNRHTIFHAFSGDIYYNLENYLKVFHSINFLSYLFGLADKDGKMLTEIERMDVDYKWKAFEKIKLISGMMKEIKSSVYNSYSGFDKKEFEQDYFRSKIEVAASKMPIIEAKLKVIDTIIDMAHKADVDRRKKSR